MEGKREGKREARVRKWRETHRDQSLQQECNQYLKEENHPRCIWRG
jgi:hypothetical protein